MSLEDAILKLAEAIEEMTMQMRIDSIPPSALELDPEENSEPAQTSIRNWTIPALKYDAWPTGEDHGNFGKPKQCSICGKHGVNKRTHLRH